MTCGTALLRPLLDVLLCVYPSTMYRAVLLLSSVLFVSISTHPTSYPEVDISDLHFRGAWPPPFRSFHIHCLYGAYDAPTVKKAMQLRQRFIEEFKLQDTKPCAGLFHQERLCMFDIMPIAVEGSPFLAANWAAFVPHENFHNCTNWIMQNRGDLDILVHPNSGAEVLDHTDWSLWGGRVWPLNLSAFSNGSKPTEPLEH